MFILGLWMYLMPQPPAPPAAVPSAAVSHAASSSSAATVSSQTSGGVIKKTSTARAASNIPLNPITIETDDYIAVFSNQGAVLTSFQLKKYPNRQTQKNI